MYRSTLPTSDSETPTKIDKWFQNLRSTERGTFKYIEKHHYRNFRVTVPFLFKFLSFSVSLEEINLRRFPKRFPFV